MNLTSTQKKTVLAAFLGWTLDAFDFFLLVFLLGDIAKEFGGGADTPYILGMAKVKGKVKILLDINKVLTGQEMHGLEGVIQVKE